MITANRVALVDIGRTLAIVAMVIFHFNYDLELFGITARGTMTQTGWVVFAWCIAGSFLFLSGVSLVLATLGRTIDRRKYTKRLALIGAAALTVSIGTYMALGQSYVRFGILHHIFAASILGLLFLHRPYWLAGVIGIAILAVPHVLDWPMLNGTYLIWIARTLTPLPQMVDYVPLIPWFGMFLLGMSLAQLVQMLGQLSKFATIIDADNRIVKALSWPGKHSLAIYLLHQPVLFGCLYLARNFLV